MLPVSYKPFSSAPPQQSAARASAPALSALPVEQDSFSAASTPRFGMLSILSKEHREQQKNLETIKNLLKAINKYNEKRSPETTQKAQNAISAFFKISKDFKLDEKLMKKNQADISKFLSLEDLNFPFLTKTDYPGLPREGNSHSGYINSLRCKLNKMTLNLPESTITRRVLYLPSSRPPTSHTRRSNEEQMLQAVIIESIKTDLLHNNPFLEGDELNHEIELRLRQLTKEQAEETVSPAPESSKKGAIREGKKRANF